MDGVTTAAHDPTRVRRGIAGTYVAFIAAGAAFGTFASRIPQFKSHLGLDPSQLGLLLLVTSIGSITALPLAGSVVHWLGSARAVALCAPGSALGLAGAGLGYEVGVWLVAVALFVLGFTIGTWDVSMNVHAAAVEQRAGRAIMARFHAGYSVGSVVGAGLGALAILTHVPVPVHLCVMAVVVVLVVPWGARMFYPEIGRSDDHPGEDEGPRGVRRALVAWRERRTVLIGLVVLAFALAEGAGNDWVSVALVDDHGAAPVVGTLGLTAFLTAMTVGRWFGPAVLDRYGRVRTLRVQSVMLIVGVVLFVFGQVVVLAVAGALLWGVGVCLGFPVGMSAAADDPARAPARVSVVASIGYCAFLAGPPLLGFLGQHLTVSHALLAAAVLVAIATLVLGAVRPLEPVDAATPIGPDPANGATTANRRYAVVTSVPPPRR